MSNELTLSGWDKFRKKLEKAPAKITEIGSGIVFEAAQHWVDLAKRSAPVDQAALVGRISAVHTKPMEAEVVSPISYSPFVEWGTKKKAKVPSDMSTYASSFKGSSGSGSASDFRDAILAWVKRKGIKFDSAGQFKSGAKKGTAKQLTFEQTGYIIYHFILLNGIKPHPFFFIQKPFIEKEMVSKLDSVLKSLDL